jgi:glyoxylate/hydroxypyruvate reductase
MTLFIDLELDTDSKRMLLSAANGLNCIFKQDLPDADAQLTALCQANIAFGNPPKTWLQQAEKLRWLQLGSVGFDYLRDWQTTVQVTNLQDFFSQPCAETMLAGILSLYRGMNRFVDLQHEKHWVGHSIRPSLQLLEGKKVLILGAGNIAKRLTKLLQAFDCELHFYARTPREGVVTTAEAVEQLIPKMDIIIGCLPGIAETNGFFSTKMLDLMSPNALFCNVGRGNLVADEAALANALKQGKIAGAVLDVTAQEPLPPDSPLWNCPNTLLSQHSGGGDAQEIRGMTAFFIQNLKKFRAGQPLLNVVELQKGY